MRRCCRAIGSGSSATGGPPAALGDAGSGRLRWAASHLVFALLGTALLLAAAGAAGGLAYGAQVHDVGGQFGRVLGAALVQLPATWVLAGLGVALIGLARTLLHDVLDLEDEVIGEGAEQAKHCIVIR